MKFLPNRLKDIRLLNGNTIDEIAVRLNVTKQSVSKYENGKTIPSAEVLNKLVDLYELPLGYLTKEEILPEERSLIFYRKNRRTPKKECDRAGVYLKWFYEMIVACGTVDKINTPDLPSFEKGLAIEETARMLREKWNLGKLPIENLADVLSGHGVFIFTVNMENTKLDGYSQIIGGYPIIVLNRDRGSIERKNFSLAHELGHLVLHTHEKGDIDKKMEDEADMFAGSFLMPEDILEKEIIRIEAQTFIDFGRKWHVSPQAVLERCIRLGLLGNDPGTVEAKRKDYFKVLNKKNNGFIVEGKDYCTLQSILRDIENKEMGEDFLQVLLFPIGKIQALCCMPEIFESYKRKEVRENIEDIEGVQLSFLF